MMDKSSLELLHYSRLRSLMIKKQPTALATDEETALDLLLSLLPSLPEKQSLQKESKKIPMKPEGT